MSLPAVSGSQGCQWLAPWWRSTRHRKRTLGTLPSCASVADPWRTAVSPTRKRAPAAGVSIAGVGGVFPGWIVTVAGTDSAPWLSRTRSDAVYVPGAAYVCDAVGDAP